MVLKTLWGEKDSNSLLMFSFLKKAVTDLAIWLSLSYKKFVCMQKYKVRKKYNWWENIRETCCIIYKRLWFGFFQIFQGCGNPKVITKASNIEDKKRQGKPISEDKPSGLGLEKLVSITCRFPKFISKKFIFSVSLALLRTNMALLRTNHSRVPSPTLRTL